MAFDWKHAKQLGLSGELRVMSELVMRNHNPAKPYLDNGSDLILENGLRIQVKTASNINYHKQGYKRYCFSFRNGYRNQNLDNFDYAILWCVDDNIFYIVPPDMINHQTILISNTDDEARNRFAPYKERWDLLGEKL